jgi:citrate synthase
VLAYCGYDIHDLAQPARCRSRRSASCCGTAPADAAELGDLQSAARRGPPLPEPVLRLMRQLPPGDGMDALRTLTSALAHYDPDAADRTPQASYRKAVG